MVEGASNVARPDVALGDQKVRLGRRFRVAAAISEVPSLRQSSPAIHAVIVAALRDDHPLGGQQLASLLVPAELFESLRLTEPRVSAERPGRAFEAAQASGQPAILHLKVDPQAISPGTTLDAIREKSLAARGS